MDVKNMTQEELKEAIKRVMSENFALENIADDADFAKDLNIDSIGSMELLLKLEDEFGVRVEDKDAQEMTTVNKTAALLQKIAAQA